MKVLLMAGHHVHKGRAVILEETGEPVRFFGEKRASKVRRNRRALQSDAGAQGIRFHPISVEVAA